MKKSLFSLALGALALTGCTSEDVISIGIQSNPISFENAVMKQSRAVSGDMNSNNLTKFMVYGYYTTPTNPANPVQIFGGDAVTKSANGEWTYSGTRFWVPEATYKFFAYSCADVALSDTYGTVGLDLNAVVEANRQLTISNFRSDAHHQHDLIYAEEKKLEPAKEMTEDNPTPNAPVTFTFEHILTKVDAVFTSEFSSDYDIVIKNVKISNFRNVGNFTHTAGWSSVNRNFEQDPDGVIDLQMEFGSDSTSPLGECTSNSNQTPEQKPRTSTYYLLPYKYATPDVYLSFTIELYKGQEHTAQNLVFTRNMNGHWAPNWQQGYYYTYNISITGSSASLQPIVFEVSKDMNDWKPGSSTATDIVFGAN